MNRLTGVVLRALAERRAELLARADLLEELRAAGEGSSAGVELDMVTDELLAQRALAERLLLAAIRERWFGNVRPLS